MPQVDLNADLGESFGAYTIGNDEEMLQIISSANVACGFHGGDPVVMHRTLELAQANGVGVGAHPGFDDLWGFGRRQIRMSAPDVEKMMIYQLGALQAMATAVGTSVTHFKVHGALNNMASVDDTLALAVANAVKAVAPELLFVVLPGSALERAGDQLGLRLAREIFADRAYDDDAMLVSRGQPGAMIEDASEAAARIVDFVERGGIVSQSGQFIPMQIDTICVHGDSPGAVAMAGAVRAALIDAGIEVVPMAQTLA